MRFSRVRTVLPAAAAAAAALVLLLCGDAAAQCAMCKTTSSNLDPAGVKHLNFAIALLLVPPVGIFCAFFVAAYRRRNSPADDTNEDARPVRDESTLPTHESHDRRA